MLTEVSAVKLLQSTQDQAHRRSFLVNTTCDTAQKADDDEWEQHSTKPKYYTFCKTIWTYLSNAVPTML